MRQYIFIALLLSSCGVEKPNDYAAFEPIVSLYLREAGARGIHIAPSGLSIHIVTAFSDSKVGPNTVGVSYNGTGRIELLKSFWDIATEVQKENLLFHELSHNLLEKEHIECDNIMCEHMLQDSVYTKNRTKFLDKLFEG